MAVFVLQRHEPALFAFRIGDADYSVPQAQCLTYEEVRAISDGRGVSRVDATRAIFEAHAPGCTDGLTIAELRDLFAAWNGASKASMGESSPSSE
jgi:hypothetical protein